MVKYLLGFIILLFMLSTSSFARNPDGQLQKEYGPQLTRVPFFLRFDFYQKYHINWKDTYYDDRRTFLAKYDADYAADQKKAKAEAKAQAEKEKEYLREKKEALLKEKARKKAELDKEKAEREDDEERQKEFDSAIKAQKDEIQQMKQSLIQNNR